MTKRFLAMALTVFMLLPTLVFAANMQVNSSAVPVSGGTISPSGIKFSAVPVTYTAAPKAGWSLTNVKIDGVITVAPYTVPYDTSKVHTVVATFAQTLSTFTLTATAGAGGTVIITGGGATNIKATDNRSVVVGPNTGYTIATCTVDGFAVPAAVGSSAAYTVDFTPFGASNHTVVATFSAIPVPTVVNAGFDQNIAALTTNLAGSVSDATPVAWTYTGPVGAAFGTPTKAITTFTGPKGTYTVTLAAGSAADSATIILGAVNTTCIGCHAGSAPVTEYNASGHAANSHGPTCNSCHSPKGEAHGNVNYVSIGAGCVGCHNGNYSRAFGTVTHFANATTATFKNISAAYVGYKGKGINVCSTCHFSFEPHVIGATTTDTFTTNMLVLDAWAESGHGDRAGLAWVPSASHAWRNSGSTVNFQSNVPVSDCVRCHTAAGYNQFVTSDYTNVNSVGANDGLQKFNSPLDCSACHAQDVASGSVTAARVAAAGVATFYNISAVDKTTKKTVKSRIAGNFPDVGESNICNSCHSARVVGPNLTDLFNTGNWNLSNASFQNSHYMAASGNMYMKTGFKNFTTLTAPAPKSNEGAAFVSTQTYNQTLSALNTTTPDGVVGGQNSAHRRLGTPLIAGSEDYLPAGGTALTTNGPCVTCHMKAYEPIAGNTFTPPAAGRPGAGHSLQIDDATAQQLCLQCHADAPHLDGGSGSGTALYTTMNNLADIKAAMLEPQSAAFQNGLTLIKQLLSVKYQIYFDPALYPYFYDTQKDATNKTAVTDWTRKNVAGVSDAAVIALGTGNVTVIPTGGLTQLQAYRLMGACFNLNVLARDPGAYVHARTYTQRLVYDTVDYLDNNLMDFTPLVTARVLNPAVYSGMEANVLIAAPIGGLATESMAWLAGTHYSDSKGQTSVPLRLRP